MLYLHLQEAGNCAQQILFYSMHHIIHLQNYLCYPLFLCQKESLTKCKDYYATKGPV